MGVFIFVLLTLFLNENLIFSNPCLDKNSQYITFRLDDLQDYWCQDISKEIVDSFVDLEIPISVGVIGKGDMKETWSKGYKIINENKNQPLVEFVSHSFNHNSMISLNEQEKKADFKSFKDVMTETFGLKTSVFIPPRNEYDNNTLKILKENGFNILSAVCIFDDSGIADHCPGEGDNVKAPVKADEFGIYRLPMGAVIGCEYSYFSTFIGEVSYNCTKKWINNQMIAQNFSVVMLHPQEFADPPSYTKNSEKLESLKSIIQELKKDYCIVTFNELASKVGENFKIHNNAKTTKFSFLVILLILIVPFF